jgi:hypothetical protein
MKSDKTIVAPDEFLNQSFALSEFLTYIISLKGVFLRSLEYQSVQYGVEVTIDLAI